MKKHFLALISIACLSTAAFAQDTLYVFKKGGPVSKFRLSEIDSITFIKPTIVRGADIQDAEGNVYQTVIIGTQTWMASNLKTTKFNDGTPIPLVTDKTAWSTATGAGYSWYNNIPNTTYGALYNYLAVNDTKNVCPTGWAVPYLNQVQTLQAYLGGQAIAGGKLKSTGALWKTPNQDATDSFGFNLLPVGIRTPAGEFVKHTETGYFWAKYIGPINVSANYANASLEILGIDQKHGLPVRCIKQ